jgi:hypothetical protein
VKRFENGWIDSADGRFNKTFSDRRGIGIGLNHSTVLVSGEEKAQVVADGSLQFSVAEVLKMRRDP